ncbi:hypothetical protein JCM8547_008832 [Rhodosporidiobolus lusitaniae]
MLNPLQSQRVRHGAEDEETAYALQLLGAREGFIKGALVGGTMMALANWRFPFVQRQTLAGKVFLASWVAIFGMVTHADHYLLEWEAKHRVASEKWRTMARNELAARGTVPSETAMRAWKADYDAKLRSTLDSSSPTGVREPTSGELWKSSGMGMPREGAVGEGERSKVMQEIELGRREKEGGVDKPSA